MKKIHLLYLILLMPLATNAQNFISAYTNNTGGSTIGADNKIVTDHMNNVINATCYTGTINAGSFTLTSNGVISAGIIKKDQNDSVIWARSLGCGHNVIMGGMFVDDADNIYVAGYFGAADSLSSSTLDCNPFPLTNTSGTSVFLIKYSPSGNVLWSRAIKVAQTTGSINGDLQRISGNGTDRIVITTYFAGIAPQTIGPNTLDPADGNLFFAVADNNGNWLHASLFGGNNILHVGMSIAVADNNDMFFAGQFKGGSVILGTADTLTNSTSTPYDFVCKADANGNFIWGKLLESSSWWSPQVLRDQNDVFLFGSFGGTIHMGATTLNSSYYSAFFSKLGSAGNFLWAKKYGDSEATFYAACRNDNYIYLAGKTIPSDTVNVFDTLHLFYHRTLPAGNIYATVEYLIRADLNGNPLQGACYSFGFATLNVSGMACTPSEVYLTGNIGSHAAFGSHILSSLMINSCNYVACYSDSANIISGRAFYDLNSNSQWDAGDISANVKLAVSKGTDTTRTMVNGFYSIGIGKGTFVTTVDHPPLYYNYSPLSYTAVFTGLSSQADTLNDFAFQPVPNQNDLGVQLSIGAFRPGFYGLAHVTLKNIGTTVKTGTMSLLLIHPDITIDSCIPAPVSISGNSAVLAYNLGPVSQITYAVRYYTSATAPIGDSVLCIADASDITDLTPADNTDTVYRIISASYDPNCKEVFPAGSISPAFVSSGKPLEYVIQFQNTGTDTAFTVLITDSISSFLNMESFQLISSSHPVVTTINGRQLWFRFYHINLPDSNTNEMLSHGYVKFSMAPLNTCIIGDEIINDANIYFDYNSPVVTNSTHTLVQDLSGITEHAGGNFSSIFPNPLCGDDLQVSSLNPISRIEVRDAVSRLLVCTLVPGKKSTVISLSSLNSGMYFISIATVRGNEIHRLIKL